MPWVPTTDFEEEVVNLQPHHDFIYGVLSEAEYSYPRPKAHTEYAANKKIQSNDQQMEYEKRGKINSKLHVMQQVQLMANTKAVGEQPCIEDWESNEMVEQETIGMMRFCGMGVSVEQPLNKKVTIASYPVDNTIKVVKNGRRKVALFFDDNVFKFHEKPSDSSSELDCSKNGKTKKLSKNDSLASKLEDDTSFNTSSSLSFSTAGEYNDSLASIPCPNGQPAHQYEKLLEDTSLLSLDSSGSHSCNSSRKEKSDSFETAEETSCWRPIFERDEDIFNKKENWPVLSKKSSSIQNVNNTDGKELFGKTQSDTASETDSCNRVRRKNFLDRFIKSEDGDFLDTSTNSASTTSSQESKTYASIAKAPKVEPQQSTNQKNEKKDSSGLLPKFPPFYTTRRMYALKRNVK